MGSSVNKSFALTSAFLLIVTSLSIVTIESATAQTPPASAFTVSTVSGSYVVPTTYSTNPYTGANTTSLGYTVVYFNIVFTIQNPPNASAYILELKGHYTSEWSPLWNGPNNVTAFASSGSQTVITIYGNNSTPLGQASANNIFLYYSDYTLFNIPLGGQLDFRLQAIYGPYGWRGALIFGNAGAFSSVQTVKIPNSFPSGSVSPNSSTSTPTVSELPALAVIPLFASVFVVLTIIKFRKTCQKK